jgi:hypothetical protein
MANALKNINFREAAFKMRQKSHLLAQRTSQAMAKAKDQSRNTVKTLAENSVLESALEFGGTLAESAAKVKAPTAQKYLPILGLVAEGYAVYAMNARIASGVKRMAELKALAALGRGVRARATVQLADELCEKAFK